MKVALGILIVIGLVAAMCAAVLVKALTVPAAPQAAAAEAAEAQVLVSARSLSAMSVVDASAVTVKKVSRGATPAGALTDPVQVVGKVLVVPMLEGAAFTKANFAEEGSGLHLAAALPAGKRALSIQLNDHTGMVGLLYPGCVVDVLVSVQMRRRGSDGEGETVTRTLLQGVQVLAVGTESVTNETGNRADRAKTELKPVVGDQRIVTLLVEPKQGQALQLAMQKGTLSLAMRNPLDQKAVLAGDTRVRDLAGAAGLPDAAVATATLSQALESMRQRLEALATTAPQRRERRASVETPVPPPWETVIIRGTASEVQKFPATPSAPPAQAEGEQARLSVKG